MVVCWIIIIGSLKLAFVQLYSFLLFKTGLHHWSCFEKFSCSKISSMKFFFFQEWSSTMVIIFFADKLSCPKTLSIKLFVVRKNNPIMNKCVHAKLGYQCGNLIITLVILAKEGYSSLRISCFEGFHIST